jgi:acyl-CoA synthetase
MTIQAVGDDRQPLPFGEEGELRTRGPQLMDAYTDPEVNARQMDDEGWFYTGDVGFVTEDGWIRMTGRVKDIINRGGEKFSSQDIEYAIIGHDDVREVAVAGVPDTRFGEVVAAFLVLHEGVVWTGPEGILEHLERRSLAKPKFPVVWHVLDALPRNPTGKVQKNKLQELHGEGAS